MRCHWIRWREHVSATFGLTVFAACATRKSTLALLRQGDMCRNSYCWAEIFFAFGFLVQRVMRGEGDRADGDGFLSLPDAGEACSCRRMAGERCNQTR